jgi:hypothetical protein
VVTSFLLWSFWPLREYLCGLSCSDSSPWFGAVLAHVRMHCAAPVQEGFLQVYCLSSGLAAGRATALVVFCVALHVLLCVRFTARGGVEVRRCSACPKPHTRTSVHKTVVLLHTANIALEQSSQISCSLGVFLVWNERFFVRSLEHGNTSVLLTNSLSLPLIHNVLTHVTHSLSVQCCCYLTTVPQHGHTAA